MMELKAYLTILWRRKWVLIATAAVTIFVTALGTFLAVPIYKATTTLRIVTVSGATGESVRSNDILYIDRLMNTYDKIATSRPVLQELARRLNLASPPEVEVGIPANTELIRITVIDPNPELASKAANTLADILVAQAKEFYVGGGKTAQEILSEQLAQMEQELVQARRDYDELVIQTPSESERLAATRRSVELKEATYNRLLEQYERTRLLDTLRANAVTIIEPAVVPDDPSSPDKSLNLGLGLLVGLVGGIGLAFLFEGLDSTLYTTPQIKKALGLSILGKIPASKKPLKMAFFNNNSPQEEAFRRLRTNLSALEHSLPLHTLLVTSAEPGEGKSTVVANLAFVMAQNGQKVVVIDGDMRLPTLHEIFGLPNKIGLSSVLKGLATLDEAIQKSSIPGVCVITSGPLPSNPTELLGLPQMAALVKHLAQRFDMVLIDTPALLAVSDAVVLAPIVDGVLQVVGLSQARQDTVQATYQQLSNARARTLGVVVNRAEQDGSRFYYYYHQATQRSR